MFSRLESNKNISMNDEANLKYSEKIHSPEPDSLEENVDQGQAAKIADSEQCIQQHTHSPRKAALTKREIMEALSRERFPWEE
jgi:hypothetical protein